ncbi:MAG: YjbF family lipoprotein [Gammaproteobacteria bacterium]|jgi:hypothetical protein
MTKTFSNLLAISLLLTSCSIRYNPEAIPIARDLIFGVKDIRVDSEYFLNEKASFAKIKFGRSYIIIPGLTSVNNDIAKWETSSNEVIRTKNGKIISIYGFDYDVSISGLKSMKFSSTSGFKRAFNINLKNPDGFFTQTSTFSFQRSDNIDHLADKKITTHLYFEDVVTNGFRWKFQNKYWVDPKSGLVLKTEQNIHPLLPEITVHFYYKFSQAKKNPG